MNKDIHPVAGALIVLAGAITFPLLVLYLQDIQYIRWTWKSGMGACLYLALVVLVLLQLFKVSGPDIASREQEAQAGRIFEAIRKKGLLVLGIFSVVYSIYIVVRSGAI